MELGNGHDAEFILLTKKPARQKELPFDYTFRDETSASENDH
jgi:hypothetical protein